MPCNIVRDLRDQGYEMSFSKVIAQWAQKTVAHLTIKQDLRAVELSEFPDGPKVGPPPYMPSMYRFEALRPVKIFEIASQSWQEALKSLTFAEMVWLKENCGNESYFLRAHSLDISNEKDRRKSRAILQALMVEDDD